MRHNDEQLMKKGDLVIRQWGMKAKALRILEDRHRIKVRHLPLVRKQVGILQEQIRHRAQIRYREEVNNRMQE